MATKKLNFQKNTKFITTHSVFKLGAANFASFYPSAKFGNQINCPKMKWPPKVVSQDFGLYSSLWGRVEFGHYDMLLLT